MKGNYHTKGVKATGSSSKCSSGTSNTKKGTYSASKGPMGKSGNGFKNP
jgi:hypothetical protein